MAKLENGSLVKYTCWQVRLLIDQWKQEYRETNRVDPSRKDFYYDMYCENLDEFLAKCKCMDLDKCDTCAPSDHEGVFCRCENRNIVLAKHLRESNKGPWLTQKDNKAEGESHRERSKREDLAYCIVCGTNSRKPEKGAGHYCHTCKEYDYA